MSTASDNLVLVVEDDELFATMLKLCLEKQGFRVEVEPRGDRAIARIASLQPKAVVLDGILPGKDGMDICREIRPTFKGVILMLTARDDDMDQVLGLGLGADDYLVKPVTPLVVLAHLRACLRRQEVVAAPVVSVQELSFGRFFISNANRTVRLGKESIHLTTAEFDLLWLLVSHAGTILSRDEINTSLRNIEFDALDRSIDMRISRLRRLLQDDPSKPTRIKTVRSKGYLFSPSDFE
ncbi:MAG: winged helix-turn-helix domain-containing protein [Rhodoferax sp.]|jgi:two-component system OmpR family response regulator/two-component system response regulator RstA|nr:winged helix-turn-helix domain-containing protein [Rhodoferax sp.]